MNKKVIDNDRADVGRGAVVDPFVVFIYGALMPFVPYDFVSPFLPSIDAVLLQLLEIVLKLISIFFACWLGGRIFVALIYRLESADFRRGFSAMFRGGTSRMCRDPAFLR
jgi:hypothetical protein